MKPHQTLQTSNNKRRGHRSFLRRLELRSPWTYMACNHKSFQEESASCFPTIHYFCTRRRGSKDTYNELDEYINEDDKPILLRIWPSYEEITDKEISENDCRTDKEISENDCRTDKEISENDCRTDKEISKNDCGNKEEKHLQACEDYWKFEYSKNGTLSGMKMHEYFSNVIRIHKEFIKHVLFRVNCKVEVADFQIEVNEMLPATCQITLVRANAIRGMEIVHENVYILESFRGALRLDSSTGVIMFEDWKGQAVRIKNLEKKNDYSDMTDINGKYVIVPCGTITSVIAAAASEVVKKGVSMHFGDMPSRLDRRVDGRVRSPRAVTEETETSVIAAAASESTVIHFGDFPSRLDRRVRSLTNVTEETEEAPGEI